MVRSKQEIIREILVAYGRKYGREQAGRIYKVMFRKDRGSSLWRIRQVRWGRYSARNDHLYLIYKAEEVAQFQPIESVAEIAKIVRFQRGSEDAHCEECRRLEFRWRPEEEMKLVCHKCGSEVVLEGSLGDYYVQYWDFDDWYALVGVSGE